MSKGYYLICEQHFSASLFQQQRKPEEVKKPGTRPRVNYNQTLGKKHEGKSEDLSR
jgi:hypothetical protein